MRNLRVWMSTSEWLETAHSREAMFSKPRSWSHGLGVLALITDSDSERR